MVCYLGNVVVLITGVPALGINVKQAWISVLLILLINAESYAQSEARTDGLTITMTDFGVVDKVGAGLYTTGQSVHGSSPTIVAVLGGSEGGYPTLRYPIVKDLLSAGHNVASIAYHGAPGTPKHLSEVSIDAVSARIEALSESAGVSKGCVGILGISKGGELTLLLASLSDVGDAHVAMTPSDVVWQASNPTLLRRSSWTHLGQPLPFVSYPWFSRATMKALLDLRQSNDLHALAMRKAKNLNEAHIPIERAKTPILIQAGTKDEVWPTVLMSERLLENLRMLNPSANVELRTYELGHFLARDATVRADGLRFLAQQLERTCP